MRNVVCKVGLAAAVVLGVLMFSATPANAQVYVSGYYSPPTYTTSYYYGYPTTYYTPAYYTPSYTSYYYTPGYSYYYPSYYSTGYYYPSYYGTSVYSGYYSRPRWYRYRW
jgi:hypothetical protein